MSKIVSLRGTSRRRHRSTLVLVDLHEQGAFDIADNHDIFSALVNCRIALSHARTFGIDVAFVRRVEGGQLFGSDAHGPKWLPGFVPRSSEMVFDRSRASCYTSPVFTEVMDRANGDYALCGLFAESECLMTIIDAYYRNHKLIYLADASACLVTGNIGSADMHDRLTGIIRHFGPISATREWVHTTSASAEISSTK